jgi:hypothetical protein
MSRNGTGTYNLPAGNPVITGTTISTTWANTTLTDIATALTGSVASDGQTPMTSSLNLNTNKIVNLGTPTADQDAATKVYVDTAGGLSLLKASNLSDVANVTTSRTNLSAAKSGANSDITSITGLTTPLTVAQGGIGAATLTANNVILGNGTSAVQVVAPSTNGNILTSNGTTWTSAAPVSTFIGSQGQVFTASGTFTVPANVTAVKVTVLGGGGNGGASSGGSFSYCGGGGGGGLAVRYVTGLTPAGTVAVTVGGIAGTSSFGAFASATGGASVTPADTSAGGAGGAGSSGTYNIAGGSGGAGVGDSSGAGGGGGGSNGSNGIANVVMNGGAGVFGRGGTGVVNLVGLAANGFGNGGSGSGGASGAGGGAGAGTGGIVVVEW